MPVLIFESSFGIGRYVNEFIISFFEQSSFKLGRETIRGSVLCYSHQACCLLYYLCKINNGIHIYQFTFELVPRFSILFLPWSKGGREERVWEQGCVSRCGCGFGFEQKYWRINGFGGKRYGSADLHTPIHSPHL